MLQEQSTKNIILTILQNRNTPIKRKTLRNKIGSISDRDMRDTIEQLVKEGYPILNFQDGAGYLLSYDPNLCKRMEKQEMSRLKKISQKCKTYRKFAQIG